MLEICRISRTSPGTDGREHSLRKGSARTRDRAQMGSTSQLVQLDYVLRFVASTFLESGRKLNPKQLKQKWNRFFPVS